MARPIVRYELTFGPDATSQNSKAYFPTNTNWGADPRADEITTVSEVDEWIVIVQFSSGAAAGKMQIQAAHSGDYGGVWANVGSTIDWAAQSSEKYAAVSGVFPALRVNIDTAVTTGTVRVFVVGMGSTTT